MGYTPDGDARIAAAVERSMELGEVGVQVAAYLDEELIVDAWGGVADPVSGGLVEASTLFPVFSVTKAVTATALHVQAERGLIDYGAPVADYWPEFAANGKAATTVRDVLSHRAGIPWMPEGITPELQGDWGWMVGQIARMSPTYEPGTTNCYHALIWGWIVGELVRRTDPLDRAFEDFVREELLDPLGIDDLYLGLPESEASRVATLIGGGPTADASQILMRGMPLSVFPSAAVYNERIARRTVNPGAGAIGTARAFVRLFAMLANRGELDGVRLLSPERVEMFLERRDDADSEDLFASAPLSVSAFGYFFGGGGLTGHATVATNSNILWHLGAGGSLGWAELDTGLSVAILHNQMHAPEVDHIADHPFLPIADAVRAVAADRRAAKVGAADSGRYSDGSR